MQPVGSQECPGFMFYNGGGEHLNGAIILSIDGL